ncbi:hypothetical protein KW795_02300 [Candidatus Microgenomates bacterium]|nr:hypothetical protein [Candidatus Microgenomates bacterium]
MGFFGNFLTRLEKGVFIGLAQGICKKMSTAYNSLVSMHPNPSDILRQGYLIEAINQLPNWEEINDTTVKHKKGRTLEVKATDDLITAIKKVIEVEVLYMTEGRSVMEFAEWKKEALGEVDNYFKGNI